MRVIAAAVLAAMMVTMPASAQESRDLGEQAFDDADRIVTGIWRIWSSPARMEARDMEGVAAAFAGAAVLSVLDQPVQEAVRSLDGRFPMTLLAPFREPRFLSTFGLSDRLIPISVGLWAAGLIADSRDLRDAGTGCLVSNVSNSVARHLLARLLSRARPQEGRGPYHIEPLGWGEWEMRSFPGGHGANITTCTTYWTRRFDLGGFEPAMWTLVGAINLGRVADEAHWLSDAAFGIVFGYAVGRTVADWYLDRLDPDEEGARAGHRAEPSVVLSLRFPLPWNNGGGI